MPLEPNQSPLRAAPARPAQAPAYLDHAASTPLHPAARAAMAANDGLTGNPAALHGGGRAARALLEDSREALAALLGAEPDEVMFTSGGSEADTIAVLGTAERTAATRPGVVIGGIEHPAVARVRELLPDRVRTLGVDAAGFTGPEELDELLAEGSPTGLVSLMWVNNELGTVQPVLAAAELAHRAGAVFHTDAVQAFGHVDLDFAAGGADLMSVSAHKLGGPVGIGALVVRRGTRLPAWGLGGRQEAGVRSGTQAAVLAAGFAAAARQAVDERAADPGRLRRLRERLIDGVAVIDGVTVNGGEPNSGAIVNLGFEGASAEDVMFLCDQQGIWCSTGSACRAGVHGPSEVLLAMGRDERAARSGVRFSFGWSTTEADIDRLLEVLPGVVARARSVPA